MMKHLLTWKCKLAVFFALGFFGVTSNAQQNSALTLRDAVIGAYGEMSPQTLEGLSWLPSGTRYAYFKGQGDARRLVIADAVGDFYREVTLTSLNKALVAARLSAQPQFPAIEWLDQKTFLIDVERTVLAFDCGKDSLQTLLNYSPEAQNMAFNADAMAVAYTVGNNLYVQQKGQSPRAITTHQNEAIVAGQAIHRFEFGIGKGIFWSPDGKRIAFYEKDDSRIPEFPIVDYTADPVAVKGIRYPLAGRASQIPKVGVFDLSSGEIRYLETGPLEEEYLTNLTWSEDGQFIYLAELDRDQRKMDLVRYDAKSGERVQRLFTESHDKYVEPEHGPIFIPGAKGDFLWYSERDGFNHLYAYKSDGTLIRQVTTGHFDIDEVLGFDNSGRNVIVTAYHPALERNVYRVHLRSGKMARVTNDSGYHSAQLSSDGSHLVTRWSAPDVPARQDLYTSSGKLLETLFTAPDPLADKITGDTELVHFDADDGTKLYGRLVKPSHFDPENEYPVLVYVYGGPHVQLVDKSWLHGAGLWMLHLAEQGYLVFTVDNRGSSHRGLAFEQATFRQLGLSEIADQLAGVEFLKTLPYADTDNMAVYGWSFGGFMTASLMLRTPGIFDVGVAGGAVTDWRSYEVMYTERYMDTPAQNPEGYERADLKNYVGNLQGDLLLIHGTADDVVILDHAMDLLNAFIDNGIQVDYFNYPGYAHNVRGKDRLHLKRKILNYVMDRIPPTGRHD